MSYNIEISKIRDFEENNVNSEIISGLVAREVVID